MANHCEPGYLSVVRPVCDFTNTGTECHFQGLVWSIMVKEVELPYTLNSLTPTGTFAAMSPDFIFWAKFHGLVRLE